MIFTFCGMLLPNAAMIDSDTIANKVRTYCLNSDHARGGDKAYLFRRLLGITQENSEILITAIYEASQHEEAQFSETTQYCDLYDIIFPLITDVGKATIRTGWCVKHTNKIPHLITAFIE
jgi:filamentous hemagglutinin